MDNQQFECVKYHAGAYITIEGKPDIGCFYIVQQGKVRISKEMVRKREEIEILGIGDFIGAVSAMSCQSQIETAQAISDTILIKVQRNQYIELIQNNPSIAMKILMQFSRRLRHLNHTLASLTLYDTSIDGPAHLFYVGEFHFNNKQYEQAVYAYNKYISFCPKGDKVELAKEKLTKLNSLAKKQKHYFKSNEVNRTYEKNSTIFAEGEYGNKLFIIQRGSVKISKIDNDKEVILAILRTGDTFGEMALLEDKPRLANATAYEDSQIMAIDKAEFMKMVSTHPQLIDKITNLLAGRIWFIYKKMANALIDDPVGRIYDAMYIQMEKNRFNFNDIDLNTTYILDFGWPELLKLAGLPEAQSQELLKKILKNTKIQVLEHKIHIVSVVELVRQTEYYRKANSREHLK